MKISENKLRECLRKWVKIISGPQYEEEGHLPFPQKHQTVAGTEAET